MPLESTVVSIYKVNSDLENSSMASEWDKLREFNGSVEKAFEELCAQLARAKQMPKGARFTRNGPQDGGIEFFWTLANGDVWGWQAKYFRHPPNNRQWRDIKESYEKALDKYPTLKKYTICMPQDRANPKQKKAKHLMDKWEEHTAKWTELADEKGRKVEFDYWGTSEIFDELVKPEHSGRLYFWFHKEYFGLDWFEKHINEQVANAHNRYLPKIHVGLTVEGEFEALSQSKRFVDELRGCIQDITNEIKQLEVLRLRTHYTTAFGELKSVVEELVALMDALPEGCESVIDFKKLEELCSLGEDLSVKACPRDRSHLSKRYQNDLALGFQMLFGMFSWLRLSRRANMACTKAMALSGDAGQGKTHLFCHIASERVNRGLETLLFFGHDFDKREPWAQMLEMLGLTCKRDELLGALNAAAEAMGIRGLILVDALNESEDPMVWHRKLAGMLQSIKGFPYVGIAVSLRTEYEDTIIPETLDDRSLPRVTHPGFTGKEAEAVKIIFDHYGINEPTFPILDPEFSNPLFLITLCKALQDNDEHDLPTGWEGFTWVLDLSLNALNKKLSNKLDFDRNEERVQQAVLELAVEMVESGKKWLTLDKAKKIFNKIHNSSSWEKSLFRWMVEEGLLQRFMARIGSGSKQIECVRFSYERFTDHIIVRELLGKCKNLSALREAFSPGGSIHRMIETGCPEDPYIDFSLLRAFAIQIPEDEGFEKELFELYSFGDDPTWGSHFFLNSLVWRKKDSIGEQALRYMEKYLLSEQDFNNPLLDGCLRTLLVVGSKAGHPFNADYLGTRLMGNLMHQRDLWWSKWLHSKYYENNEVMRLIEWGLLADHGKAETEQVRLVSKSLAWFFTTSNRFIRDKATKAMVSLLEDRIPVLRALMGEFVDVDDPYVLERICAVAYGCAMRTTDDEGLKALAEDIYKWFFENNTPPVNILIRDYARGVIEVAVQRNLNPKVDLEKVRPPYKSEWTDNIPSMVELKKRYHPEKKSPGLGRVWNSVTGHIGDFGIYIIGPMSDWLEFGLDEDLPKIEETDKEPVMELLEDLTGEGKEENVEGVEAVKTTHKAPITVNKLKYSCRFSTELISRIVLNHVLKLGYTSDLDDGIDVPYIGRDEHKSERMGKKYQWIAYHQTLAMIADHFHFRLDEETNKPGKYDGPWQIIRGRDIDPSITIADTNREDWVHTPAWWSCFDRTGFERECEDLVWLKDDKTIPNVSEVLDISRDGTKWINADTYVHLEQNVPAGVDKESIMRRSIWYSTRAFLIKKADSDRFMNLKDHLLKKPNSMYHLIPDTPHLNCFLGEFPHLPAFRYEDTMYYGRGGWWLSEMDSSPLVPLMAVSDQYFDDRRYDCSHDKVISFYLPSAFLIRELKLKQSKIHSHLTALVDRLFAFDPSVTEEGPSALLLNRSMLSEYAELSGLDIVAYVNGRKDLSGHEMDRDKYLGALLFFGAFKMVGNVWDGELNSYFLKPS